MAATHYEILHTAPTADEDTIKKAYRKFALTHHPDKTLNLPELERKKREHAFKLATTAYEVLGEAGKRAAYDRTLRSARLPPFTSTSTASQAEKPSQKAHASPAWSEKRRQRWNEYPEEPSAEDATGGESYAQHQARNRRYAQPGRQFTDRVPPQNPPNAPEQPQPESQPQHKYRYWQPPAFQASDFSSGRTDFLKDGSVRSYLAPVSESGTHTEVRFANHQGWDFSISICKKFKLVAHPILPPIEGGADGEISITLPLQRIHSAQTSKHYKEILLEVKGTFKGHRVAVSSLFVEKTDGIELRILLGTDASAPLGQSGWTWGFNADAASLVSTAAQSFRVAYTVSHAMYWPMYPKHAVLPGGEMPVQAPYPPGSPLHALKEKCADIVIPKLKASEHCKEEMWAGRYLWRLAAVGLVLAV